MSAAVELGEGQRGVAFIGGYGRSGSTLLDRLLGQIDGFVSVGEFYWLWRWSLAENQRCGCGAAFRDCAFWGAVFARAFGGFDGIDVARILALQAVCEGRRYSAQPRWPGRSDALAEYRGLLGILYHAVLDVSGARVVVDSSKFPARAFVLQGVPGLPATVVHVVRDSRAVAYSWQRTRLRPELAAGPAYMPRKGPVRTALAWTVANLLTEVVAGRPGARAALQYESLLDDPARALAAIARRAGEHRPALEFLAKGEARLDVAHTVAGNPMRFAVGAVPLAPDSEWQTAMLPLDRRVVTALTFPLLRRYGYLGRAAGPRAAGWAR